MLGGPEFAATDLSDLCLHCRDSRFQLFAFASLMLHRKCLQVLQLREKLWPGMHNNCLIRAADYLSEVIVSDVISMKATTL
jgi:hypothetical protein